MKMIKKLFKNDLLKITMNNIPCTKRGIVIKKLPPISPHFLKIPYDEQYESRDFKRKN